MPESGGYDVGYGEARRTHNTTVILLELVHKERMGPMWPQVKLLAAAMPRIGIWLFWWGRPECASAKPAAFDGAM
jgi:hypothetical protein